MPPSGEFALALRRLREAAGFKSARSFYQALGGRPFFGCTYKQYLNIEAGRSRPGPALVEKFAIGLRITTDEQRSVEFATAYLRTLIGRPELVDMLADALSRGSKSERRPLDQALERSYTARTRPLSREESALIRSSLSHYWAFTLLANDEGSYSAADLARRLGLKPAALSRALEDLAKSKLISRDRDGRYRCPQKGMIFLHPRDSLYSLGAYASLRKVWDPVEKGSGGGILMREHLFTRASESALRAYWPELSRATRGSDLHSTIHGGADTGFFLIEASIRKVLPF